MGVQGKDTESSVTSGRIVLSGSNRVNTWERMLSYVAGVFDRVTIASYLALARVEMSTAFRFFAEQPKLLKWSVGSLMLMWKRGMFFLN